MSDKTDDLETSFAVIFKKLAESQNSDEVEESRAVADEAEEIQELRRIVEEATAPACLEFATT